MRRIDKLFTAWRFRGSRGGIAEKIFLAKPRDVPTSASSLPEMGVVCRNGFQTRRMSEHGSAVQLNNIVGELVGRLDESVEFRIRVPVGISVRG